jgi:hypothetical protein
MSPSFLPDARDMRLFEHKSFQVLWQKVLRTSDYSITDVDIGNLTEGTRVHGYMCVHPDSVLAILMENWEGRSRPRPHATQELQRFNTGRAYPIERGLLGSSLIGSVDTVDQTEEDADRANDTSIGTERSNTEGTDERTEDDESIIYGKSDETIRTTESQLNQAASVAV